MGRRSFVRGSVQQRRIYARLCPDALRTAQDLSQDVARLSSTDLQAGARGILEAIALVVRAYHRKRNVSINVNYMVPEDGTPELLQRAHFCDKTRRHNAFRCFLVLKMWAYNPGSLPTDFVLPVDRADGDQTHALLIGAPSTFVHDEESVIRDTLKLKRRLKGEYSDKIRSEICDYFKAHRAHLRSFASWPLSGKRDAVLGVVNIQSNKTAVLGLFPGNQRKLGIALLPFLDLLSRFVVRMHGGTGVSPPSEQENQDNRNGPVG